MLKVLLTSLTMLLAVSAAHADEIPPGVYRGSAHGFYSYGSRATSRCSVDVTSTLTLTVLPGGAVTWRGLSEIDGDCTGSTFERAACWTHAEGALTLVRRSQWRLTSRPTGKAAVPPLPSDRIVWKCGRERVVLSDLYAPPSGRCVRIGRYVDRRTERSAQLTCSFTDNDFPELVDTTVTLSKGAIVVRLDAHGPKKTKLERVGDVPPAPKASD
jgi:hypothetical protein